MPETVREVRSILGLARYDRKFTPQFVRIAAPLTDLMCKDTTFGWSLRAGEAFTALKEALMQALVLQLVHPSLEYTMACDASDFAIEVVLSH